MKLKQYLNLLLRRNKFIKPARFTFRNMLAVLQSVVRKRRMNIDGFPLALHIYEQIIWRRTQVMQKSPSCWDRNQCIVCGCDILGKTMEDRGCERIPPCYPHMMNEKEWKVYKINNSVKLFE